MTDVQWGVLGAGWLVQRATGEALRNAAGARLLAAAARDVDRARRTGATRPAGSYRAIVDDPDVEAVYVALANEAHLPWIRACIAAGKHVLCEKPLVLTGADAEALYLEAESAGVLLVEAAWSRWHPRMRRIVDLATNGSIGEVEAFLGTFTFKGVPPGNFRLSTAQGGGALYDVGIYPLHVLFACLPDVDVLEVLRVDRRHHGEGVDLTTKAAVTWGGQTRATVVASFEMPPSQRLVIRGSEGEISVDDDQAFTSWRVPTDLMVDGVMESFPPVDAYRVMFEEVSAQIRGSGGWVLPPRDSIRVAHAVDALRQRASPSP